MRRHLLAPVLPILLLLPLGGCGGDDRDRPSASRRAAAQPAGAAAPATARPFPLLAVEFRSNRRPRLHEVDPMTLRRRPGRPSVALRGYTGSTALAPSGLAAAFGVSNRGRVQVVGLDPLQPRRVIHAGESGSFTALAWPAGDDIVGLLERWGRDATVVRIDLAVSGGVVGRTRLDGVAYARAQSPRHLAVVTGPVKRIGPALLAVVSSDGVTKIVALPRTRVGQKYPPPNGDAHGVMAFEEALPGVAIDEAHGRVLVVPPTKELRVIEVPLGAGDPVEHVIAPRRSIASRIRDFLEPTAEAKMTVGSHRTAQLVGGGRGLLVTGFDGDPDGSMSSPDPTLVDLETWEAKSLGAKTGMALVAGDTVLVGGRDGLTAFDATGAERWRAFTGRRFQLTLAEAEGRVYVSRWRPRRTTILDLATGQELARVKRVPPGFVRPGRAW